MDVVTDVAPETAPSPAPASDVEPRRKRHRGRRRAPRARRVRPADPAERDRVAAEEAAARAPDVRPDSTAPDGDASGEHGEDGDALPVAVDPAAMARDVGACARVPLLLVSFLRAKRSGDTRLDLAGLDERAAALGERLATRVPPDRAELLWWVATAADVFTPWLVDTLNDRLHKPAAQAQVPA